MGLGRMPRRPEHATRRATRSFRASRSRRIECALLVVGVFTDCPEFVLQTREFLFGLFLELNQLRTSSFYRRQQLVELEMDRMGMTVLSILNEEHHEKCDDRRAGIDDQLPAFRKAVVRARYQPDEHEEKGYDEDPRRSHPVGSSGREPAKHLVHVSPPRCPSAGPRLTRAGKPYTIHCHTVEADYLP